MASIPCLRRWQQLWFPICEQPSEVSSPTIHQQGWFVYFVDVRMKDQISVVHCSGSKHAKVIENLAKIFADQLGKAFVQQGCISPFSEIAKIRVSFTSVSAKLKSRCLASMLVLERYNGSHHATELKTSERTNRYTTAKLVHLLLHESNTVELREVIDGIVQNDEDGKKKKRRKTKK
ncbi:hypothetical protein ZWY2020_029716 [Hordeum vulgare]|nr:hypothetical protein ZWY2020_029716 [Hordeum vulgare]